MLMDRFDLRGSLAYLYTLERALHSAAVLEMQRSCRLFVTRIELSWRRVGDLLPTKRPLRSVFVDDRLLNGSTKPIVNLRHKPI